MDVIYASLTSLLVLAFSFSLHYLYYKYKPTTYPNLPPGQSGWPIIGENIEFLSNGWKGHPETFIFDRMAKFSRHIFRTSLMLEDVAVFCGSAGNKFLFSNENTLVQAWWPSSVNKIMPSATSSNNVDRRKIIRNCFKPEALQKFIPIMDMLAQQHFETEWEGMDRIITHEATKNFTFLLACKIFISIDQPERVKYLSGPFETFSLGIFSVPIDLPGTPLRRAINGGKFIRKEIVALMKQRKIDLAEGKGSPTQDIMSQMICDEDGKLIPETEIADLIIGLLIGGHDNASSTCAFIVKFLAELPEIYEGVYKEQVEIAKSKAAGEFLNWDDLSKMKYSWSVACEVLRLAPPLQGTFREAITDFVYNGYSIPKGWKLYWNAHSTHKNGEVFPEPQKFDPSRFYGKGPEPYTFVPFGGGPHLCPGKEYARLEILVFMHHLVRKFKWSKVIPDEQIILHPMPKLAKGLPICLYPHNP